MSSTHHDIAAAARHRATPSPTRADTRTARSRNVRYRRPSGQRFAPAEIALLLLLVAALALCAVFSRSPQIAPGDTSLVRIGSGDTVWDLAQSHPVAGLSTAQTAQIISDLNHLQGGGLVAGSVIRVPTSSSTGLALR